MSCNRTICTIWHECDKALGEDLKPLCAEENFNSLQLLKAEIAQLKKYLIEDGYNDSNIVFQTVIKIEQLSAVQ